VSCATVEIAAARVGTAQMPGPARRQLNEPPPAARIAAPIAATLLFVGVGMLGWLAGHVATYGAVGVAHLHHAHGYMHAVGHSAAGLVAAALALTVLALVVGRRPFATWVRSTRDQDAYLAWVAAAMLPAATFFIVELIEGSVAATGNALLLVGMPLQALLGMLVLWCVRELLGVLVQVAEQLAASAQAWPAPCFAMLGPLPAQAPRRSTPMASGAPRRGPPLPLP
jgi:hypothetical protein